MGVKLQHPIVKILGVVILNCPDINFGLLIRQGMSGLKIAV